MRPLGRRLGFGFGCCLGLRENSRRRRRGGKVGISRLRRDFQGSVGDGGNLILVFAGFHAPAFSTAFLEFCLSLCPRQFFSRAAVPPHHVWAEADRYGFIQVLVDHHRAPRQGVAEPGLVGFATGGLRSLPCCPWPPRAPSAL